MVLKVESGDPQGSLRGTEGANDFFLKFYAVKTFWEKFEHFFPEISLQSSQKFTPLALLNE